MNPAQEPATILLQQGLALQKSGQLQAAEQAYAASIAQAPHNPLALHLLGTAVGQQGRWMEAIGWLQKSLRLHPADPKAWNNLATAFLDSGQCQRAKEAAERALALAPEYPAAQLSWASACYGLKQFADGLRVARTLVVHPGLSRLAWLCVWRCAGALCDWSAQQEAAAHLQQCLDQGDMLLPAFDALAFADDPALHRRTAQFLADKLAATRAVPPRLLPVPSPSQPPGSGRIKLAYLSADFHDHATAYLMAELFERHDKGRFETVAISFGPDSESPMRKRLHRAFDQFWDVRDCTPAQVAERMVQAGIDIAVDLKGHTRDSRPAILLRKPAPIIVNYLGYPGTMGSPVFDYLVGDSIVTPAEHAPLYDEQLVQLPHSYQVNDTQRPLAVTASSRADEGLPAQGVVFAAFNNVYKVTRPFFQAWMRLLQAVPGSVLWLISDDPEVQANLRREAVRSGVEPMRLVFAKGVPLAQHLARHVHADMLLDNLPVNAHTTTSDALWAGVPVVTCMGQAFAGRVAASLLHAVGLPELVTHSLADYEALALRLATQPAELQRLRSHLQAARATAPLFDTVRFTRYLETAYLCMHQRRLQGLSPAGFAVPDVIGAPVKALHSTPTSFQISQS
ncbi:tetratricopeptide repeat protein [Acidovorax sp. 106]|uniref:O-linked N-acetylglucosamine transferase, SPINDLY family protein n=1 Tax=Acidovorax sp. 106 TaxID=2135637 RepID=UPI000EABC100|nr:tetratricopeptide repeat protein [Acidovorax sp. 106]RLJ38454.1 putative O-linked N-acetylglucosamine transferase (SPINDLY family) [Acidovorax sp. 106]